MDNQREDHGSESGASRGFNTPGSDQIIESTSEAVPSASRTTEERLPSAKPAIESLRETPGDANPALAETTGFEQGSASTADLLRAREVAEERLPRTAGVEPYQDQGANAAPQEYEDTDTGRPTWPNDQTQEPMENLDAPRGHMPLGASTGQTDLNLKGRLDAAAEREETLSASDETRSGLSPVLDNVDEAIYEREEMGRPTESSDLDRIAPGMVNLAPEDEDGR